MFRGYVSSTLDLVGELLLTQSVDKVEVHQCLGNLLTALITSLGPDLQVKAFCLEIEGDQESWEHIVMSLELFTILTSPEMRTRLLTYYNQ